MSETHEHYDLVRTPVLDRLFAGFRRAYGHTFLQYSLAGPHDRMAVVTAPRATGDRWGVLVAQGMVTRLSARTTTPEHARLLAEWALAAGGTVVTTAREGYAARCTDPALKAALATLPASTSLVVVHDPARGTALVAWSDAVVVPS